MNNRTKCAIIIIVIVAIGVIVPQLLIKNANAQLPFGGPILSVQACNSGFLILIGPPVAGFYMFTIPPIGINVLGMAAMAPIPCVLGIVPMGAGLPVLYFASG